MQCHDVSSHAVVFYCYPLKASRREVIDIIAARKRLESEINSLTDEVELLERSAAR